MKTVFSFQFMLERVHIFPFDSSKLSSLPIRSKPSISPAKRSKPINEHQNKISINLSFDFDVKSSFPW